MSNNGIEKRVSEILSQNGLEKLTLPDITRLEAMGQRAVSAFELNQKLPLPFDAFSSLKLLSGAKLVEQVRSFSDDDFTYYKSTDKGKSLVAEIHRKTNGSKK